MVPVEQLVELSTNRLATTVQARGGRCAADGVQQHRMEQEWGEVGPSVGHVSHESRTIYDAASSILPIPEHLEQNHAELGRNVAKVQLASASIDGLEMTCDGTASARLGQQADEMEENLRCFKVSAVRRAL